MAPSGRLPYPRFRRTMAEELLLRIAHGYGNRRARIDRALAAGVDVIEADLRAHRGHVWVRHERRLPGLPLLYNYRLGAVHREGPYGLAAGPLWLRLDRAGLPFAELLERVDGRVGLLLDLKAAPYGPRRSRGFCAAVLRQLREARFGSWLGFTGSWPLLDLVRARDPETRCFYSVDDAAAWRLAQGRLAGGALPGVSLRASLADEARTAALCAANVPFLCWEVADEPTARTAAARGATGVLAGDLAVLERLRGTPVVHPGAA
ncbi:MAG: hypothetical protein IT304_11480 [Dehalococcoidia bacterium]|nr:hypothetical protein [Dehalococcoidia bacterium]